MKSLEAEMEEMRQESAHAATQLRTLKASIKDGSEALNQHKGVMRRAVDEIEKKCDVYSRACAIFADALKVTNPAAIGQAAAAV